MIVPQVIEGFSPERKWESLSLPKDGVGDRFLPYSKQSLAPPPVSQDWSGDGIILHVMPAHAGRSVDDQLEPVLDEGFITPRRYAAFSTRAEMGWGGKENTAVLVYRTPYRWTREFLPVGEAEFHPHAEAMIGLSIEQAREIAPRGTEYHLEYCSDRRLNAIKAIGVLAYVPPTHLLGVLRFRGGNRHELPDYQRQALELVDQYAEGQIEEDEVGPTLAANWTRTIDMTVGLSGESSESLFAGVAAAYTGAKLLGTIQEAYFQDGPKVLRKFRPSYPLTKQIHQAAITELNDGF